MSIAESTYVAFTTFRKSGEAVTTPVWIAPLGQGRAGFTTGASSGKAKRLARTPAVTLQPCNARGDVESGTQPTAATARVVNTADHAFSEVRAAVFASTAGKSALPVQPEWSVVCSAGKPLV